MKKILITIIFLLIGLHFILAHQYQETNIHQTPQEPQKEIIDRPYSGWNFFGKSEPIDSYSIHKRTGIYILGISIVTWGYILFIFVSIIILAGYKSRKKKNIILFFGLGIYFVISSRNLVSYTSITYEGLKNYTFKNRDNKNFAYLGDYVVFTKKIRDVLSLDTQINKKCSIYLNPIRDATPYDKYFQYVYLKPCEVYLNKDLADYIIYYKTPIGTGDIQKKIIVEFNESYLLSNK